MGDWNLFFTTAAGSAAALVGLLFVAMKNSARTKVVAQEPS